MRSRVKYLRARDWEMVAAAFGREAAGRPPAGARLPGSELLTASEPPLPREKRVLDIPAIESSADYARRQRRQQVDALLVRRGVKERPGW